MNGYERPIWLSIWLGLALIASGWWAYQYFEEFLWQVEHGGIYMEVLRDTYLLFTVISLAAGIGIVLIFRWKRLGLYLYVLLRLQRLSFRSVWAYDSIQPIR